MFYLIKKFLSWLKENVWLMYNNLIVNYINK